MLAVVREIDGDNVRLLNMDEKVMEADDKDIDGSAVYVEEDDEGGKGECKEMFLEQEAAFMEE